MGTLQALEAIKLLSGETPAGEPDCSTVNEPVAQPAAAPVVARYAEEAMQILFNDQPMQCAAGQTVHELLEQLDQRQAGAALAINQQIVPREQGATYRAGWRPDPAFSGYCRVEMLRIADKTFDSHLFTGTGKFASSQLMVEAIRASGSQLVTLAMKRVDLRQHNDAILEPLIAAGDPAAKYIRGENSGRSHFRRPSGS